MSPPITMFADISVLVEGAVAETFNFGSIMLAFEHSVSSNRLMGPYLSIADVEDAGFTEDDEPEVHEAALTVLSVPNGVREIYIGLRDPGDASWGATLSAIEAIDPDAFYGVMIESRLDADIVSAAAWCEARNGESLKVGSFQSGQSSLLNSHGPAHTVTVGGTATDGTYRVTFTGYGLGAPVNADVVRATTPATNAALATAIADAIDTLIATTLAEVVQEVSADGLVVTIKLLRGLASGTITQSAPAPGTLTVAATLDTDIYQRLAAAGYRRCILTYSSAADYKDAAALSRGLGFKFDEPAGAGQLAYKQFAIVEYDPLDVDEALNIAGNPPDLGRANFYGRKYGLAFYFSGVTPAGAPYFFDITTSIDWFVRRSQEAIVAYQVGQITKIGFDRGGIVGAATVFQGILDNGVTNAHFLGDKGSEPVVIPPELTTISAADKLNRILRYTNSMNKATFLGGVLKIVLVMRMSF